MDSRLGWAFAGVYALAAMYLLLTQGPFGESFVAMNLGLPWTLVLAGSGYSGVEYTWASNLLIIPMILNGALLYWVGSRIGRWLGY